MPDPSAGPLARCPVCGRTGLVGKEREIAGARAVTVYKCHGCDNSWRVRDDEPTRLESPRREPEDPREPPVNMPASGAHVAHRASATTRPPRLVILGVGRAEAYQPHGTEVCISITDPKAGPVRLSPDFKAVLRLAFSDIASPTTMQQHVLFAPEHAHEILDFVDRWAEVERIMIHCVGGLSRSPAVGMALCDLREWPLGRMEAEYPLWNSWVRSELVRIGRERQSLPAKRASRSKGRTAKPRRPASRAKTKIRKRTSS
jgi:hypothetical protein